MRMRILVGSFALFLISVCSVQAQTSVAPTPPMGWNSWNHFACKVTAADVRGAASAIASNGMRSEEHTSELQSQSNLVCRLLLEKKKNYLQHSRMSTNHQHVTQ